MDTNIITDRRRGGDSIMKKQTGTQAALRRLLREAIPAVPSLPRFSAAEPHGRPTMIRDSAFRRSPLLLLAAALVALAVLFVHDARPASAQITIWSATLTVQDITSTDFGDHGFGCAVFANDRTCGDSLSPSGNHRFTYQGTPYTVARIYLHSGDLHFVLDNAIPSGIKQNATLHVGRRAFSFADVTLEESDTAASWSAPGLRWSEGDTVQLSLTIPATVTLSASPDRVTPVNDPADPDLKKAYVTITATLSGPLPETVWIPVTVTAFSADPNPDHGTISRIGINPNELTGTAQIRVWEDLDTVDDIFSVALDRANLPSSVIAGSASSVAVVITDTDPKGPPTNVSNFTVTPKVRHLLLSWNKPTGRITHYEAQFKTASAPDQMGDAPVNGRVDPTTGWIAMPKWSALKTDDPATASTTDNTSGRITVLPNGLTAGTAYDVRLRAVNHNAAGPWATGQGTPEAAGGL